MASKRKSTPKTKIERLRTTMKAPPRDVPPKKAGAARSEPPSPGSEGPGRILATHMMPQPEAERVETRPSQTDVPRKSLIRRLYDYLFNAKGRQA